MGGTAYSDFIKPFQITKNGRESWIYLKGQYDGEEMFPGGD